MSTLVDDTMTPAERRDHYTLPEQRIQLEIRNGGRGTRHIVEYHTDPTSSHPGRWTRRAASRRSLCGRLGALVVGVDAASWPTERIAPDMTEVTCARCMARARRIFAREGDRG